MMLSALPLSFFNRPTLKVARELLGKLLVRRLKEGIIVARIVETEAYTEDDPACHASRNVAKGGGPKNPKARSAALFAAPGTSYVYFNYGMYWMMNVVTDKKGRAGAVLIRALEILEGIDLVFKNRPKVKKSEDLANGPGKLCLALNITGNDDGKLLKGSDLYFAKAAGTETFHIESSARIGISSGLDRDWRFFISGNKFVSKGKPGIAPQKKKSKGD